MVRSNRCTMKWHPGTVSDSHASRSSRLPPSRPSSASVRARNSSMTRRSNSLSSSGKSDPLLGSLKPLSRRLALISSCRLGLLYQSSFHYDSVFFMVLVFGCFFLFLFFILMNLSFLCQDMEQAYYINLFF